MVLNLNSLIIQVALSTIIGALVLWIAGRSLVGEDKAKFTDAVWIIIFGNVIGAIFGAIISDRSIALAAAGFTFLRVLG